MQQTLLREGRQQNGNVRWRTIRRTLTDRCSRAAADFKDDALPGPQYRLIIPAHRAFIAAFFEFFDISASCGHFPPRLCYVNQ